MIPLEDLLHPHEGTKAWHCIGLADDFIFELNRDGLKGGPQVARNFCLALLGCCLAKQLYLLLHLCTYIFRPLLSVIHSHNLLDPHFSTRRW